MAENGDSENKQEHPPAAPTANQEGAATLDVEPLGRDPSTLSMTDVLETPFGAGLEHVLRQCCGGRLSEVSWFRTDWQRGGAVTGYAVFRDDEGADRPVVCKLPVPPRELAWLTRLQDGEDVAPRLFASGEELGGYDIAWVVMERLSRGPLDSTWGGREFELLIEAAGRFYQASSAYSVEGEPRRQDWEKVLRESRDAVKRGGFPDEQRWSAALKKASKKIKKWSDCWENRPIDGWVHGDLHFGNAMTRSTDDQEPAVLFDFAEVRPGNWVEDAVYFEHLFWSRRDRLGEHKLCSMLSKKRRELGLAVDSAWAHLAEVRRSLVAISTPLSMRHDGNVPHARACLELLEREVA